MSQSVAPPSILQSHSAQPYILKELTGLIKICPGCRLGYINRSPPFQFDVCLVHQETRTIKNSVTKQDMIVPVNAHYHVTAHCVRMKDSAFTSDQLIIPVNLQGKIKGNPAGALILQVGLNIH